MKRVGLIYMMMVLALPLLSQEVFEKTMPFTGQELDLDVDLGEEIIIKAWDKDEIYLKITYEINGGELNDALKIDIDDYKDRLSVDLDLDKRRFRNSRYRGCDGRNRSGRNYRHNNDDYSVCAEIKVEVFMPEGADVLVNTIIADVEIEDMVGNIEVETITGNIDVSWSSELGADVAMKTVTGAVYTNLDIDRIGGRNKGLKLISSHNIKGVYKTGGKEVNLETVTSNIYLRASN